MQIPTSRLVHALIGKSIAETILVGSLAVAAFVTILPPYFHGWGEVSEAGIAGWAVSNGAPWARVEVQLFVDGRFTATTVANLSRPDVPAAGWAKDEWHGYVFSLPRLEWGAHEARVYAMHDSGDGERKSLQLLGDPIPFLVDGNGKVLKQRWR